MNSQKQLVEGALFAAIFIVMLLISAYIPPVGAFSVYLLPLPLTIFAYRNDLNYAVTTMIVSIILSFLVAPPFAIINAIMASIAGTIFGTMIRMKISPLLCFLALVFTFTMEFVAVEALANTAMGYSIIDQLLETVQTAVNLVVDKLPGYKMDQEYIMSFARLSISGIFVLMGILNALLCFSITSIVFNRLKYQMIKLPNLKSVKAKRILVIIYFAMNLILGSILRGNGGYVLITTILVNVYLVLSIYFLFLGYIEFCSYINSLQIDRILKVVICLSSIFVFGIFLLYFGIFKSLFNGEKKLEKK